MTSIYTPFGRTGESFADRCEADDTRSAIGRVVVGFGWLKESLANQIQEITGLGPEIGAILTTEMQFGMLVRTLSSLVRRLAPGRRFNVGKEDTLECWDDITRMLFECEKLRNGVVNSTYE